MSFLDWWEQYRERRRKEHAASVGDRFGDAPTSEEMAQVGCASVQAECLCDAHDVRLGDVRVWKERRLGVRHAPAAVPSVTPVQERSAGQ